MTTFKDATDCGLFGVGNLVRFFRKRAEERMFGWHQENGDILLSDGFCLVSLPGDHPLLTGPRAIPHPPTAETPFVEWPSPSGGRPRRQPKPWQTPSMDDPLTVTPYLYETHEQEARVFLRPNGQTEVLVARCFLDLLSPDVSVLGAYLSFRCDGPTSPVAVRFADVLVMVIMPMYSPNREYRVVAAASKEATQ